MVTETLNTRQRRTKTVSNENHSALTVETDTPTPNTRQRRTTKVLSTIFRSRVVRVLFPLFFLVLLFFSTASNGYNDYLRSGWAWESGHESDSQSYPSKSTSLSSVSSTSNLNSPELHKTATVMAMATGYKLSDYQRFVGSLRKTGYMGNIILVVSPTIETSTENYLAQNNVIMHKAQYVNCSHPVSDDLNKANRTKMNSGNKELVTCVHPFPNLKHRWARFPLLRNLLLECGGQPNPEVQCGGPILITDMRDTFFQRNPFGPEAPRVEGLQVFQEHYTIRTTHWLVEVPVSKCKGVHYNEPMLCSGTTIGTRQAMLDYLEIFHGEMKVWMASPKCCCNKMNGDDQSMHNYLYYSGMLDGVTGGVHPIKNRAGLVNTVGAMGSLILNTHKREKDKLRAAMNNPNPNANGGVRDPFDLSTEEDEKKSKNWLGLHYGMTDSDGYFTQFDGSRSYVIHQWDRFGPKFRNWLTKNSKELYENG